MRSIWISLASLAAPLYCLAATAAAAQTSQAPAASQTSAYDPFESSNRWIYRVNQKLDQAIVRPGAIGYMIVIPRPVRVGVRNVLNNIDEPNTAMNDILQARANRGAKAAGRFLINSTVGVGGLFDIATRWGLARQNADFGQTLGRWGVAPGPYLYVPVIGPSDVRDGLGRIVDAFTGLLDLPQLHVNIWEHLGVSVVDGLDTRGTIDSTLEDLNRTATDPYVTIRSAYLQNRQSMIIDTPKAIDQLPSFDAPPSETAPSVPPKAAAPGAAPAPQVP